MVSGSRIEGGAQVLSAGVRKTIQSIKEIVGNHSDADIYRALKETNMDPNETAQKLLNQDPFHEVKRKRNRKKENSGCNSFVAVEVRKSTELAPMKYNANSDHNARSGRFSRNFVSGASREFRVIRDNRVNENAGPDSRPAQTSASISKREISSGSVMSNAAETSERQKSSVGHSYQVNGSADVNHRQTKNATSVGNDRKELLAEKRLQTTPEASQVQAKANDSQLHFTNSSNSSTLGVYSSSSDPVHVPPLNSRVAANVGAIRCEVGVVGFRRQQSKHSAKSFSFQSTSSPNMQSRQEVHSRESARTPNGTQKSDQPTKNIPPESAKPGMSTSKSFSSYRHGRRPHQKASQPNKEWKPKSSLKPSPNGPEVGIPAKTVLPPTEDLEDLKKEAMKIQDNMSRLNITENQNVIIAAHIRVSETDRCQLTFGSLGADLHSIVNSVFLDNNGAEELSTEPSGSISVSGPKSSGDEPAGSKQMVDGSIRSSGSNSPASGTFADHQLTEKKESSSSPNMDNYADVPLVRNNEPYTVASLQQQDASEMQSFSGYDSQKAYNVSYFQPTVDENEIAPGHGLPSSQEMSSHHTMNAISASSIAMVQQQQQQQLAQMYPQHQISQFANVMPYRQFLSPMYGPPMSVPGYSNNPMYPHSPNDSSYLLIPGNNSHLSQGGLKYGIQQFKPVVSTGSPTGFGNFNSPISYSLNTPGVFGNTMGLEDSSRLNYKDSFFVPNPQAETSEIWTNPRDIIPNMQTASYYNMPGQPPHTYFPSHNNHGSFNASQSSHMQFPGIYHPSPQPSAIPSHHHHHHLGHPLGGNNVGLGMAGPAPGTQVGAYQQPQLGHLNWPGNF